MKKKIKRVYIVCSLKQDNYLVFGSKKRATKWIENYNKMIFDKSDKNDLYISDRVIF